MPEYAANLRRLLARQGLTVEELSQRCGLDQRTIKGILAGHKNPHARTIHELARGLDVDPDELFQDPSLLAHRLYDRQTNPAVAEIVESRPELFVGWTEHDFDKLYGTFGIGGALTSEGVVALAEKMNIARQVHQKVSVILETGEAELLRDFVDMLHKRVIVPE